MLIKIRNFYVKRKSKNVLFMYFFIGSVGNEIIKIENGKRELKKLKFALRFSSWVLDNFTLEKGKTGLKIVAIRFVLNFEFILIFLLSFFFKKKAKFKDIYW